MENKAPEKNIAATQQGDEPPKVFTYEGSAFEAQTDEGCETIKAEYTWQEQYEAKFADKSDERYGLVKHNNTMVQMQIDWISELLQKKRRRHCLTFVKVGKQEMKQVNPKHLA